MELTVLGIFCLLLILSLTFHFSILLALSGGLILFLFYGAKKGFSARELTLMTVTGVKKASNILLTMMLIGVLTALWRAAGTIPTIVSYSASLLHPSILVLMAFLLNCMVSFLTGTAFGTGATMGVICGAVASAMGASPVLSGGAILSGAFFGDRCSPVSTSMLLVSELTETEPYENIRIMLRRALVPFLVSCLIFGVLGRTAAGETAAPNLGELFSRELRLHPVTLIPAAAILLLAVFRVKVKKAMIVSICCAIPVCMLLQGFGMAELVGFTVHGFRAEHAEVGVLLNGGGVLSMIRVCSIVCISSCYAGIFEKTGLLSGIQRYVGLLAKKTNAFTAVLCTSVLTAMASCNQTLSIMLTDQLCQDLAGDNKTFASWLEDTAVVVSPLIPWSIAGSTVLYSAGMPLSGILAACYLYLLPVWGLVLSRKKKP